MATVGVPTNRDFGGIRNNIGRAQFKALTDASEKITVETPLGERSKFWSKPYRKITGLTRKDSGLP